MLVILDYFPRFRGENKKYLSCHHLAIDWHMLLKSPPSQLLYPPGNHPNIPSTWAKENHRLKGRAREDLVIVSGWKTPTKMDVSHIAVGHLTLNSGCRKAILFSLLSRRIHGTAMFTYIDYRNSTIHAVYQSQKLHHKFVGKYTKLVPWEPLMGFFRSFMASKALKRSTSPLPSRDKPANAIDAAKPWRYVRLLRNATPGDRKTGKLFKNTTWWQYESWYISIYYQ